MGSKDITFNLALAIEVSPDDILGYRLVQNKGYNVVLKDFRKFTGVQPVSDQAVAALLAEYNADIYPEGMIDELKPIYDNPGKFKLQEIRTLAYFLDIRDASALRKQPLIDEVIAWKVLYESDL